MPRAKTDAIDAVTGVCTDGAPVILGCHSSFQTLVKEKSPSDNDTHCITHRQAFMVKTMPDVYLHVRNKVIKVANFIKRMHLIHIFMRNCPKKAITCLKIFCWIRVLHGFQREKR